MSTTFPLWQCTWLTGPDAGGAHPLAYGRHLVGRANGADVRCDDPALQPHHALVDVRADGTVWLTQLTGRVPLRIGDAAVDGTVAVGAGDTVDLGGSTLRIEQAPEPAAAATVRDGALLRGPRAVPRWEPAALALPTPPSSAPDAAGGLVPALLGLAGAGVIALLLRQPMFLLFGVLGALVAAGSWGAQRAAGHRRRTRERAAAAAERLAFDTALADDRARFLAWHRQSVPTVATAVQQITARSAELWTRRSGHPDAWTVSLGRGELPWRPAPTAQPHQLAAPLTVADLPVPVSLADGARVAVQGPQAMAAVRAVLAQSAASCGPADLRIVVVTERPARWDCVRGLPHLQLPDGTAAVVEESRLAETLEQLDGDARGHLLLVTDSPAALATRTSPLRRAAVGEGTALLAALPGDAGVPHLCTALLTTGFGPVGRWVADTAATLLPVPVRLAGLGEAAMSRCTAALAGLRDPEDPVAGAARLPRTVGLAELLAATGLEPDAATIAARWAGDRRPAARTAIGSAADGIVDIDLDRDGPHALLAGTTGAGKSELLRSLIVGLAAHADPAHLGFVLVDYKGGATFDACRALPHVVGTVTDLDDHLADRALRSLHAELRRREAMLREHRAGDLAALWETAPEVVLPRLVVVIDEFAALVTEQPDFLHALVGVAQRGRSLGVHLVLATQRPHGVISDDIRANTNLRIALRLHDAADAVDVVGDRAPAQLPRGVPGRAVMRLGADEHVTFQTARCDPALVPAIVEACRLRPATPPPAPWLPPLPATLAGADLDPGAIGVCDDPDRQRRTPLRWTPGDGSVMVIGSTGAGVSSTLHTLAAAALATPGTHVYVLLAHGDERLGGLAAHPRCVVTEVHERERTMRLVHRLRARLHETTAADPVVLVVDGLDVVRRVLDDLDSLPELDALDDVLAHGASAGITVVCGAAQPAAVPAAVLSRCAHRWVLHLHDRADAMVLGVQARDVPPPVAGRVHVAELALAAQLAEPRAVPLLPVRADGRIPPIEATPAVVRSQALPAAHHADDTTFLPAGIGLVDGEPARLELPDGDHVLVLGGARSGRSTALARLAEAWMEAHPHGHTLAVLPRRSAFPRHLAGEVTDRPERLELPTAEDVLLVVDDVELVDDPLGVLAALAGAGRPGRTVFAAGRPDALRQSYGHWSTVLRRSRLGLVAAGGSDTDGDLVGAILPRRLPVAARPGLMWMVANGAPALVQVAVPGDPISSHRRGSHVRLAR